MSGVFLSYHYLRILLLGLRPLTLLPQSLEVRPPTRERPPSRSTITSDTLDL